MADKTFQPLEIKNFAGGNTDNYLAADINQYQRMDNLFLNDVAQPYTRPGSVVYDVANAALPSGSQPVNALINYNSDTNLFAGSGKQVYYYSAGWSEILGPNTNGVFTAGNYTSKVTSKEWKSQVFLTNNGGSSTMKIFKDSTNAIKVLNAGLPKFPDNLSTANKATLQTNSNTLANAIKTKMIAHFASAPANDLMNHAIVQSFTFPANATNETTLVALTISLMQAHKLHITDALQTNFTPVWHWDKNVIGNTYKSFGHFLLPEQINPTTLLECIPILNLLKRYFNYHIDSYVVESLSTDTVFGEEGHPGGVSVGLITSASVVIDTYPTQINNTGAELQTVIYNNDVIYQYMEKIRVSLNTHYTSEVLGAGGHPKKGACDEVITAITNDHTLILGAYKLIHAYTNHIARFAYFGAVLIHKLISTDAEGALLSTATYNAVGKTLSKLSSTGLSVYAYNIVNHPKIALDPESATDMNAIIAYLDEINTKMNNHLSAAFAGPTYRHNAPAVNLFEDYLYPLYGLIWKPSDYVIYEYALLYSNKYKLYNQVEFEDLSTPYVFATLPVMTKVALSYPILFGSDYLVPYLSSYRMNLINIPVLSSLENYPTDTYTTQIYRSIANETVLHKVGEILAGVTGFEDTMSDTVCADQLEIYTTGGVLANDTPPIAKYLELVGNKLYYGNCTDSTGSYPNRILESLDSSLGSVPETSYIDLPDSVQGLSTTKGILIAFTKYKTYRIEGGFDYTGRGSLSAIVISDQVGCVAPLSPISIDGGVVFFGNDGVYFTDAYQIKKLSNDWTNTYLSYLSTATKMGNIQGVLNPQTNRLHWVLQTLDSSGLTESILTLGMRQGIKENSCFQTMSNTTFDASTICLYNNELIRGDSYGYIYKHNELYTSDPKRYPQDAASTWTTQSIRYDLLTVATDFGTQMYRKYVPFIVGKFKNVGNLSCQIININDDGKSIHSLTPIRWRGKTSYGSENLIKFGTSPGFSYRNLIEAKRHFPSGTMRCSTKQLQLSLAYVVVNNSDTLGLCTINSVAKTATLAAGNWPNSYIDHYIYFEADNYTQGFQISILAGGVLTYTGAGSISGAGKRWVIKGYPKDERMQLLGLTIHFIATDTEQPNPVGETGENA